MIRYVELLLVASTISGIFLMPCRPALAELGAAAQVDDIAAILDQGVRANEQRDYDQALKSYSYAASRGNATAQFRLGEMYYEGRGTRKDLQMAMEWFSKAANQGHSAASQNVAFVSQILRLQKLSEYESHTLASLSVASELICPDLPTIHLVNTLERSYREDALGRVIYGKNASLVKGPPPERPIPADFGCFRISKGTLVLVDPSIRVLPSVVTVLPDLTVVRGVIQSKVLLRRVD